MDKTLRSARSELGRLDLELQATSRAVTQNKLQQARAIDRMAGIRLDAARRGEVVEHLESAMREADKILESRDDAIASINDRVRTASEAIDALEDRRETLHEAVDAAARALAEREAAVQQSLEQDEAFQHQLERTREADAIAVSALDKARLAAEDRSSKGEPFEGDELFMYLWQRGYGTSAYSANPLARMLDAWVARLCGYQGARPNYWMLLEIPKRLEEHADHARDAADAELDKLQDIEEIAARDGDVPEARAALEALEQRQDGIDEEIATAERTLAELQSDQNRYTAGEDDHLRKALRTISAAMERRDVSELTRLARGTMTADDDEIVDELRHLRRQYAELEDELREIRDLQRERLSRTQELERVRREFKRSRYDDVHSRFEKRDTIERMIGEVIAGVIQGSALWNTLRRYQRYNDTAGEWPDFGSGGIARPGSHRKRKKRRRASSWHWPGPSSSGRSGGGFKMPRPRSGGGSRGGFRTGGGF
jgi:chromosome segregation ATPase